jgi:hypothetical protein
MANAGSSTGSWSPRTSEESTFASRSKDVFDHPPMNIQIPGRFFPHADFKDALWITLQAKELTGIYTGSRGGNLILGKTKTKFKFLAPLEIMEMHNHDWQEYANVGSRLLEKIKDLETMTEQIKGVFGSVGNVYETFKSVFSATSITGALQTTAAAAGKLNVAVPSRKIDTPLTYTSSGRRQMALEFVLADNIGGTDVVRAVKLLQSFAAPSSNNVIKIGFPHIFKIETEPEGLILFEAAAITSIQPTWHHPYVKGYPVRANLTINFTDMSPLFQRTITSGTIININPSSTETEPTYEYKFNNASDARGVINSSRPF